jgi:hypothetical protein
MNDDFEKRLQRATPREAPSAWRAEILSAARTSVAVQEPRITGDGLLPRLIREFLALGRLPRLAWGGLAAAWLVILGLHFSGGPESTTPAATSAMAADQTRQALKQKQLLLVELAGAVETQPVIRPPGPRSQRRESMAVT